MASQGEWTNTSNVATTAVPSAFLTVTVGTQTATQTLRLWNNLDGSAPAATTMNQVRIYVAYDMGLGLAITGNRPADEKWLWARANGTIVNPQGTSGADYVAFTSEWTPIGGGSSLLLPPIGNYFARELEFFVYPMGSGGTISISSMAIIVESDRGITSLGPYASVRGGDQVIIMRGDAGRYEVLRGFELQGLRLKLHPTATDKLVIEQGLIKKGNVGITPLDRQVTAAINDTAADGATAAGQSYVIRVDANPTGTGVTLTKGNKAVTGSEQMPAAPGATYTPLGYTTKPNGGALTTPVQSDRHDIATLTAVGTGLTCKVGPRIGVVADLMQSDDATTTLSSLTDATTQNVVMSAQGVIRKSTVAPITGETLVGRVTCSGGNATAVDNRKLIKAPSEYLAWRDEVRDSCDMSVDFRATTNDAFLFGHLIAGNSGAVPQTVTQVNGDFAFARCTAFTTLGTLRAGGTGINGVGTEAAATEDFIVNKVDDWFRTRTKWWGTNANTNTVTWSTPDTLVASVATYRGKLWDCCGKPFVLAHLDVRFWPRSTTATIQVYVYKVNKTGAISTLFNSAAKTSFAGTGSSIVSTPASFRCDMLSGSTTRTDRNSDGTYVMLWDEPPEAYVEGHMGEGIYVNIVGTDLGDVSGKLEYYGLMKV